MRRLSHWSFHLEEMQAYIPSVWERIRHRCTLGGKHLLPAEIRVSLMEGDPDSRKGVAKYKACEGDLLYPFLFETATLPCGGGADIDIQVKDPSAWGETPVFSCAEEGFKLQNFVVHELLHGMGLGQTSCFVSEEKPLGCPAPPGCKKTLWESKMRLEGGDPLECYTGSERVFLGGVELSRGGKEGHLMHPLGGHSQLSYGASTEECFFFREDDLSLLSSMGYECEGSADSFTIWIILVASILACGLGTCCLRRHCRSV